MKTVIRLTVVAIVALLGIAVLAQEQPKPKQIPLGDVVKQQKAAKKATRVITDDDIPARPPEPAQTATATGANAAGREATADKASKTPDGKSAAAKPAGDQAREKRIADLKYAEEAEKKTIQKMEDGLADPNISDNRRRMYEDTLRSARELLEKFQKEREELEKQGIAAKPPATPK